VKYGISISQIACWAGAAIVAIVSVVLIFFPAAWIASAVDRHSGGRVNLIDPQGTLWRGSASVATAATHDEAAAPLLPGRFSWRLSPSVLLGNVDLVLDNPATLSQPVQIRGDWHTWQIGSGEMVLAAGMLTAIGAPLNTIQPSGDMRLSWGALQLKRQGRQLEMQGPMALRLRDIASQLSLVKPLGSYQVTLDWAGMVAQMKLGTLKGPLLLNGSGELSNGRLQFSGQARADAGQEEKLANLINLLGQRRADDQHTVALEFK
jgi:general secretion pathway protein N